MTETPSALVPHDHSVSFYADDEEFAARVAAFAAHALAVDDAVIVIATSRHRGQVADALARRGVDLDEHRRVGRYLDVDAATTLAAFATSEATLDADHFMSVVGGLVRQAAASGRAVRAFGEMVGLLWAAGDLAGAVELESLWNRLALDAEFTLACAYPLTSVTEADDLAAVCGLCDQHSLIEAPSTTPMVDAAIVSADEASAIFFPHAPAISGARRFTEHVLELWHLQSLDPDVSMIVSELATNAVCHAATPFRVTIERGPPTLRISVHDGKRDLPERQFPGSDVAHGRGIALLDSMTARWGSHRVDDGKVVWAELVAARN